MIAGGDALLLLLALTLPVTLLFQRLGVGALTGYLLVGAIAGPGVLALVDNKGAIEHAAEIGVALLLFTIGLELDLGRARQRLRAIAIGSSAQLGLTIGLLGLATWPLIGRASCRERV